MPRARERFVVAGLVVALVAASERSAGEDAPVVPAVLPESLAAPPTLPESASDAQPPGGNLFIDPPIYPPPRRGEGRLWARSPSLTRT